MSALLYLLFIFGLDPSLLSVDPEGSLCRTFAILIHFVGLSVFAWTAIEGYQLHKALVKKRLTDADGRYSDLIRAIVGYGLPAVIVALTLCVAYVAFEGEAYGHGGDNGGGEDNETCWLQEDTFIYTFTAPAAVVIVFNVRLIMAALM